jgi:hypothetical protein
MSSVSGIFDKTPSQPQERPKATPPKPKYPDVTEYKEGQHLVGSPRRMSPVRKNIILTGAN